MTRFIPVVLLVLLLTAPWPAGPLFAGNLEISRNGTILVDGKSRLQVMHFSDTWFPNRQSDANFDLPVVADGAWRGEWKLRGSEASLQFETAIRRPRPDHWQVEVALSSEQGVPTAAAVLQFEIPANVLAGKRVTIDGKALPVPQKPEQERIGSVEQAAIVAVPLASGVAELKFETPTAVTFRDSRVNGSDFFIIRIMLPQSQPVLKKAALRYTIGFEPYRTRALDLCSAANMGLADEVAGDREGGWTDQGPENDMRQLLPGKLAAGAVEFHVADPAENHGKSVIALGGGGRPYFPPSATVAAASAKIKTLFLLHTVAWPPRGETPVGAIRLRARSGRETVREVVFRRDVENWWQPVGVPNGNVVWSAHNSQAPIGLYMSAFQFDGAEAESVCFESNGAAVWMIVAASVSEQEIELPAVNRHTLWRGEAWRPFTLTGDTAAGSALDFSFLLDAPAGKYGFVRSAADGTFRFEDRREEPFRAYGTNLCMTANYVDRYQADALAERLSRIGYNVLRFHHFDRDILDKGAADSVTFDEAQRDRLEYLIAALKKRGIYITLDLFTMRPVKSGELPYEIRDIYNYKLLAMIDPAVLDNLKQFTRNLLTHVNPHTGLALTDEPALVYLSLINENTLIHLMSRAAPEVRALYEAAFLRDCGGRAPENRDEEFRRFLHRRYWEFYREFSGWVRELGVKVPLTDQNYISAPELTLERAEYDYVDNHIYYDHPIFIGKDWSLPSKLNNVSAVAMRLRVPGSLAPSRVYGKPFTVTEFDFCYPNEYRAEGAPIFAACAALQDWAGIYRFNYASHSSQIDGPVGTMNSFDVVNDPVRLFSERLGLAFYLRGDVAAAPSAVTVAVPEDPAALTDHFAYSNSVAGRWLDCRIGSVVQRADGSFAPGIPADNREVIPPDDKSRQAQSRISSETGELCADFEERWFRADTAGSCALVLPAGTRCAGRWFTAAALEGFAVAGAVRLTPERFLIVHLSDVKSEGITFSDSTMRELLAEGVGPLLARQGTAELSISPGDGIWQLYALDLSGRRLYQVPFGEAEGWITFTAATHGRDDRVIFAYELCRSDGEAEEP